MADSVERHPALSTFKLWLDTFQAIATILALIAALIWFFLQRSTSPQVKLDQTVTHRAVANDPDSLLITLDVRATNIGKVKVDLQPGELDIDEVNPTPGHRLISYTLKKMTLEPGESDQSAFYDIEIPKGITTIQVHSQYLVPGKKDVYWNLLSFADTNDNSTQTATASSVK